MILIIFNAPRALDSSRILLEQLGLPSKFEQVEYLWSGIGAPKNDYEGNPNDQIMESINNQRKRVDNIILMTHLEIVETFPYYITKKEFGKGCESIRISKGKAFHLDLENKTYKIIP